MLSKRFRYKLDTFLEKGGVNIFVSLVFIFLSSLLIIAFLRWVMIAMMGEPPPDQSGKILPQVFHIFLSMTDPGNIGLDINSNTGFKALAILAGITGVVIFSALIAVITTALEGKIEELKKGHTQIVESGHTLVLGWNNRATEIIRELVLANESEANPCVVVLSELGKEEMDDIIKMRLPDTKNTRIVTRSGVVSSMLNLEIVALASAKSIIVLGYCTDTSPAEERMASDTRVIKTVLGIISGNPKEAKIAIVAEIFSSRNRKIMADVSGGSVKTFDTMDILSKVLVQTSRSNGLSVVYAEIMSFDGCEMYFVDGDWPSMGVGEIQFHFPDGVVMGIRRADGDLLINPGKDILVRPDDDLLILAEDDSTIEFRPEPVATHRNLKPTGKRAGLVLEKELIIGWNAKSRTIIQEYDDYVIKGSSIDILVDCLDEDASKNEIIQRRKINEELAELGSDLEHISVDLREGNLMDRDTYSSMDLSVYNNVLVLSQGGDSVDPEITDSNTIIILLLLRNALEGLPATKKQPKLITEVMDSKNQRLVAKAGVNDFIISNQLMSMLISQISEEPDILNVYDQIFSESGSEIYIKRLGLYFEEFPVKVTFADLMGIANNRNEVCLGVKIHQNERSREDNYGINLIPEKNSLFELSERDSLVVLSEGET